MFHDRGDCVGVVPLPCRWCIGCRIDRQGELATRAMHEVAGATDRGLPSWFPTMTVDDLHLADVLRDPKREAQLFLDRLRKRCGPFRYVLRYEYSPQLRRPHYHGLFFGLDLPDSEFVSPRGNYRVYRSSVFAQCWPFGFTELGDVSQESANYVARHHVDKLRGPAELEQLAVRDADGRLVVDEATGEVAMLPSEFLLMSRRPGLGRAWIEKYWRDVYRAVRDGGGIVRPGGHVDRVPRYYDKVMADRLDVDLDGVKFARRRRSMTDRAVAERTPERLAVREGCAKARIARKRKSLS